MESQTLDGRSETSRPWTSASDPRAQFSGIAIQTKWSPRKLSIASAIEAPASALSQNEKSDLYGIRSYRDAHLASMDQLDEFNYGAEKESCPHTFRLAGRFLSLGLKRLSCKQREANDPMRARSHRSVSRPSNVLHSTLRKSRW
jgi:hypothetical protein